MNKKERFFKQLIQNFLGKKIKYIFLRGQDFISNKEQYGETDILVKKEYLEEIRNIFRKNLGCYQFKNNIDLTHPLLIRVIRNNFVMDLDFQIEGIGYCGSPFLKEGYLFKHIRKEGFYNVLDDEAEFLMLFVHGFVFKKTLSYFKKYEGEFFKLYKGINKSLVSKELTKMFNDKISKKIMNLVENKNLNELFKLRNKLIKIHLIKNILNIPKVLISKLMRFRNYFHLDGVFYLINPFKWAPLVCFIGADGSGKSTMAQESREHLEKFKIKNISVSGGVFSGIKNPVKRNKTIKNYSERVSEPQESNIKLLARIILQIPKQIKIAYYRKMGIFVITDRYAYDMIFFYGAKGFFKYLTKMISQKPTKCLYLDVNPKTINKRNKELDINAINKIRNRINLNKTYLGLIELKNENLEEAKLELKNQLNGIIKNV